MMRLTLFGTLVVLSSAQFQPSGRILEPPVPALCAQSKLNTYTLCKYFECILLNNFIYFYNVEFWFKNIVFFL